MEIVYSLDIQAFRPADILEDVPVRTRWSSVLSARFKTVNKRLSYAHWKSVTKKQAMLSDTV